MPSIIETVEARMRRYRELMDAGWPIAKIEIEIFGRIREHVPTYANYRSAIALTKIEQGDPIINGENAVVAPEK